MGHIFQCVPFKEDQDVNWGMVTSRSREEKRVNMYVRALYNYLHFSGNVLPHGVEWIQGMGRFFAGWEGKGRSR